MKPMSMLSRLIHKLVLSAVLFGLVTSLTTVHAQTPSPQATPPTVEHSGYPMDNISLDQRSPEDRVFKESYDDANTFKHGKTYWTDPFFWVYTAAFADKFRMPRQWIDPRLKGALALAWRITTTGKSMCGYGGKADSCWPTLTCQLDVYFDSQTPLPWNYTDVVRDNMIDGLTSDSYLPRLSPNSKWWRYVDGRNVPSQKGPVLPVTQVQLRYPNGKPLGNGLRLWLFDREYEPGVVLLSYTNACVSYDGEGSARLHYYTKAELDRTRGANPQAIHVVEIPEAFIKKISAVYLEQKKPNEEVTKRLYEDFLRSRGITVPASNSQK